ncbi:hypothetical protein TELCIR_08521 [Teladorsagia circumcincta]|uniref:Uncharacterized protein n=1 Tax=Teladorsagia circumcincta TaxID=45464 RepID=A0A2G9UJG0_TELCI|nr:hypothetical protein TELCIR_08521 [Teladorsagia circumcincta]
MGQATQCQAVEGGRGVTRNYDRGRHMEEDLAARHVGKLSLSSNDLRFTLLSCLCHDLIEERTHHRMKEIVLTTLSLWWRPSSDPPGCCTESRKMAANNQPASPDSGSLHKRDNSEVPKWIPPKLPPSYEAVVDVSTEKPIGTRFPMYHWWHEVSRIRTVDKCCV